LNDHVAAGNERFYLLDPTEVGTVPSDVGAGIFIARETHSVDRAIAARGEMLREVASNKAGRAADQNFARHGELPFAPILSRLGEAQKGARRR
jgi:hypothetical protein